MILLNRHCQGLRKRRSDFRADNCKLSFFLTYVLLMRVIALADSLGVDNGFQQLAILAWEVSLGLQSEGVPLQRGDAEEAHGLPSGSHSGIWLFQSTLHGRLMWRKHRPNGSWLQRGCACVERSPVTCLIHRVAPGLNCLRLASRYSHALARSSCSRCGACSRCWVRRFTLKGFRAGRATSLACQGKSLAAILRAGEWRSAAVLRYLDIDSIDPAQLFEEALDSDIE